MDASSDDPARKTDHDGTVVPVHGNRLVSVGVLDTARALVLMKKNKSNNGTSNVATELPIMPVIIVAVVVVRNQCGNTNVPQTKLITVPCHTPRHSTARREPSARWVLSVRNFCDVHPGL